MLRKLHVAFLSALLGLGATVPATGESLEALKARTDIDVALRLHTSTGQFAPYYLTNNRYGTLYQRNGALVDAGLRCDLDTAARFSLTYGARLWAGVQNASEYDRYTLENGWGHEKMRPAPVWLQELWAGVKWRCLELEAGMRQRGSSWLNNNLSSGDLIHSSFARPIPQVRIGFIDFQDIPFTHGWAQINVNLAYGKFFQNKYLNNQFNHYYGHITDSQLYCYREVWFRSNPDKPLSVTIGTQLGTLFGGTSYLYRSGILFKTYYNEGGIKGMWKSLFPTENNGDYFYEGQHVGSWNLRADYRLRRGDKLSFYFQWPWEDGSGMRKGNGWDGLWGLEWRAPSAWYIDNVVAEYLDLTNQSGPVHWAPQFHPGSGIDNNASGSDDYYNNFSYNAYINNGLSLGTPMMMSPIYNLNGYPLFRHTRVRAYHIAASGHVGPVTYTARLGRRLAYGSYYAPVRSRQASTMASLEAGWCVDAVPGLSLTAGVGLDRGTLPGNTFGALVEVGYTF